MVFRRKALFLILAVLRHARTLCDSERAIVNRARVNTAFQHGGDHLVVTAVAKRIQLALINLDKSEAGRRVIANSKKKLTGHVIA